MLTISYFLGGNGAGLYFLSGSLSGDLTVFVEDCGAICWLFCDVF